MAMTQEEFDKLVRIGGCVFELRSKVCRLASETGKRYCPKHQAMIDARLAIDGRKPVTRAAARRRAA